MADLLHEKHFTVEQASRMLSGIRNLVGEMMELSGLLRDRGYDTARHEYFGGSGPNGDHFHPPEMERIVEIAKNLQDKGVLIKSPADGLIDFPFLRSNGEEVYLCWKFGEEEIAFWHRIADGFQGRKPLTEL